jgi:uncharacterized damage-inducible protein DinB
MKQLLQEYAEYHYVANQLLGTLVQNLDAELSTKYVPSSFPSLQKTLIHMLDADSIWWQRIQGSTPIIAPGKNFQGDITELINQLLIQDEQWINYINLLDINALESEFSYTNLKGEPFIQPLYQILLHLFNHGTYHRGQLVTILRVLEIKNIPGTDFVHWARGKR